MDNRKLSTLLRNGFVPLAFALIALGLYFPALSGHWRWDDPGILAHALQFSVVDDFTDPEVWRQLSGGNLMPWLPLSMEFDLTLFGTQPWLFYLHHILALGACAVALYFCLRLWIRSTYAAFGGVLFLCGAPTLLVSEQLMTRHYVEGLFLSLISLLCFVRHLRAGKTLYQLLGVTCYLLAVTTKEIYVPLMVLLPLLADGSVLRRLQKTTPYIVVAALYVVWRWWMLGSLSGGYVESGQYARLEFLLQVAHSFGHFPALLFGSGWWLVVALFALLIMSYVTITRSRLVVSMVVALLVLVPMIPLVSFPGIVTPDRYLFLPWTTLCFALPFYAAHLPPSMPAGLSSKTTEWLLLGAGLLITGVALSQGYSQRSQLQIMAAEFDAHAEFVWEKDDNVVYLPGNNILPNFWFIIGLQDLKSQLLHNSSSPLAVVDPVYLRNDMSNLFGYNDECQCLQDISDSLTARRSAFERRNRPLAPLEMSFSYREGILAWEFGPYDKGQYDVVSDVLGVLPAPHTGRMRFPIEENAPFYLRYTSHEGWVTYSDLQHVEHDADTVFWERE